MPTPLLRAISRIEGSAPAAANTRLATWSSCSRLRVASVRGARGFVKAEHAPFALQRSFKRSIVRFMSFNRSQSRAVQMDSFGGPEVLNVREVPVPQPGKGQLRVRVAAAGLNPMDWFMTADAASGARFGMKLPCGFGTDYAGVVEQVGDGATGFKAGDRVFGGALSRAVADFVVVSANGDVAANEVHHTPDGVDDRTAAALTIAGRTAYAVLAVVGLGPKDTVLVGGAAGGVGVFTVQLARMTGARVIGTASAASADFLRDLGAEPTTYGDGLVERVRAMAPGGVTAAIDLYGTETALAARALGVPDKRITIIATQLPGITSANGAAAAPGSLEKLADLVATRKVRVPIAAHFPVEQIRKAVELQSARHVKGKVVVDL
ncbi:MAG: NADP-dependent oxidoreductase [Myxococcaceae bacterium]